MTTKHAVGINSASATHDRMAAAWTAQQNALAGAGRDVWGGCAQSFKADPKRAFDPLLTKIASFLQADDILIDVGGGAGRLSLTLASRCREVIVVDPSAAMGAVFDETLTDSGITNARFIGGTWPVDAVEGDVALVAHVTYFVAEIVPFIGTLQRSIRRRVIVGTRSTPPPNQIAALFRLAHDAELEPVPGHSELTAVLDEMGIPAEVIDVGPAAVPATMTVEDTREGAIRSELESAVRAGWLNEREVERVRALADERFDELFARTERGFLRRSAVDARDLLITWSTDR